jgi:hypothetical protein
LILKINNFININIKNKNNFLLMGMFRSEDIEIYKLNIHKDSDWKIMNELGKMN